MLDHAKARPEAAALVRHLTCGLTEAGLKRDDHGVVAVGNNRPRLYATMLSVDALGGVPITLYLDAANTEFVFTINNAGVSFAVAEGQAQVHKLLEIRDQCPKLGRDWFDDRRLRKYEEPGLAVSKLLAGDRGAVTKGTNGLRGERIEQLSPAQMVDLGVIQVMDRRYCFAHLTMKEKLMTGAFTRKDGKAAIAETLDKVYNCSARLKTHRTSQAAYPSGGEQQMCAIGRARMANPTMALLDEPSMGLASQIVDEVFEIVTDLNTKEPVTFLLAEQHTMIALRYADYAYTLKNGRIVMDGVASDLCENEDAKEFHLRMVGASDGSPRKSFKDVTTYQRRKRWLA